MALDLQCEFLSSPYREWLVKGFRNKKWLFKHVRNTRDHQDFLDVDHDFELQPSVVVKQLYFREKTRTMVLSVDCAKRQMIIKIFFLLEPGKMSQQDNGAPEIHAEKTKDKKGKSERDNLSGQLASFDVEIKYLHIFSRLVSLHVTPHLALPVCRSIVPAHVVRKILPLTTEKDTAKKMLGKNPTDLFMVFFAEKANHGTFTSLVKDDFPKMRRPHVNYILVALIYQIIYTLACIHIRLPSFKHNDLHTSNVLLSKIDPQKIQQVYPSEQYYVRYKDEFNQECFIDTLVCPYRTMLWDLYFASVDSSDAKRWNLGKMSPIRTTVGPLHLKDSRVIANQYTDLHKFFDTLEYVLRSSGQWKKLEACIVNFFDDVVPSAYKCMAIENPKRREKLKLHEVHHTSPRDLLQHPIFNCLRIPIDGQTAPLESYDMIGKLNESGKKKDFM